MQEKFKILAALLGKERIKFDEPLKHHMANLTEARAECFYIATSIKELEQVLNLAQELKIDFFLFGSGTKVFLADEGLEGLIIKNRTTGIKISGVKGKVSNKGIGVEEAMIEAESGVSMKKLNDFLKDQGLKVLGGAWVPESTVGGSLYIDQGLAALVQKIKIFSGGEVSDIDILELKRADFVLSAIFKVKSATQKL